MICPYNRKSQTTVLQWVQNNEDEKSNCQQIENVTFDMMECPKEGCAVWYEGKCHYAAVE
ncbi:MAG: hypothetical protein Q4D42_13195 [Eubacteriales bacterium]|nr:hypothetical protein [Eubacteriales bacterium]